MSNKDRVVKAFAELTEALLKYPPLVDERYAAFRRECSNLTMEEYAEMSTLGKSSEILAGFLVACAKFGWILQHVLLILRQYKDVGHL